MSLVDGFYFEASVSSVLSNIHATESVANGTVVASGIIPCFKFHTKLRSLGVCVCEYTACLCIILS